MIPSLRHASTTSSPLPAIDFDGPQLPDNLSCRKTVFGPCPLPIVKPNVKQPRYFMGFGAIDIVRSPFVDFGVYR